MRLPPRIIIPIAAAATCTLTLLAFLWWQLAGTRAVLLQRLHEVMSSTGAVTGSGIAATIRIPLDTGDASLLRLRRGDLFALQGEWADATGEYQQAVGQGGGLTALRKLEQAQLQIRDIPAARATLEKLRRAGARSEDLLLIETIISLRTGELTKAGELLRAAPPSPQQQYGSALLALVQGNHEETKQHLQEVSDGWEPVLRGHARTMLSAYEEFALFPNSPHTHLDTLLARALAQVQECELALPILVRVTQAQDDYRDAWMVQGYCELTTRRTREALASFDRAYAIDPEKPEIQYFLGRAYASLDDPANALTFLRYALENSFEPQADVRRMIAKQALKTGNADLVMEQEQALTQMPAATLDTFREFVNVAVILEKKQEALLKATEATQKWPDDPAAWELLGDTSLAVDGKEEARRAYETALQRDPNRSGVRGKMGKL